MKRLKLLILTLALLFGGCSPGQHSGHLYLHTPVRDPVRDPNQVEAIPVEAVFDRPMTMSVERDGTKVEASSLKPGLFEDIFKFLVLRPR